MFAPVLPEDCQVNPGVYGAELAFWLCTELAKEGLFLSYPNFEDWGWFLDYTAANGDEFRLICGNVNGSTRNWSCRLEGYPIGLFRRSKFDVESAAPLVEAILRILRSTREIEDIHLG